MENSIKIDVIILSFALTEELKKVTENCISTLIKSEDPRKIEFNVIVFESQHNLSPYQYEHSKTIYPKERFGIHRYYNMGVNLTSSPFICLCNNDVLFYPMWATEILKCYKKINDLLSASPICSIWHPHNGFQLNSGIWLGHGMSEELSGWCVLLKRDIFRLIGRLDENLEHWYTDNDYGNTLRVLGIKHALVTSSIVDHLGQRTLKSLDSDRNYELMWKQKIYYDKKWDYRIGLIR